MQPLRGILGHFIILLPSSILYFTLPAGASSGCGTQQDFIGQTRSFTIESGSTVRDYTIHLPKNYKVDTVQPLMIAYHGRTGDPDEFERATRFSDDAVNPEMIVVYPAGVKV
jgi:poly(3-hydroxybutyrate) depolymerase